MSTNWLRKLRGKSLVVEHMKKIDYQENRDEVETEPLNQWKEKGWPGNSEGLGDYDPDVKRINKQLNKWQRKSESMTHGQKRWTVGKEKESEREWEGKREEDEEKQELPRTIE